MIKDAIVDLVAGRDLTDDQARGAMDAIMSGTATPGQVGAFLTALRLKGETVNEIAALATVMREHSLRVQVSGPVVDTCGTGGDNSQSFNVSTAAAFVVAGAGLKVAKHGNRGASSPSGSADVLEALGVAIGLGPEAVQPCLDQAGIASMWAQLFHPAMKHAAGVRREIGIRTVFNILGPLTNPAGAEHQVIGVAEEGLALTIAAVLRRLGAKHALVVHGTDGLDELSLGAPSVVAELRGNREPDLYRIEPDQLGLAMAPRDAIVGGSPADNAARMQAIFAGERGPYRDVVVLNAAAGLLAGDAVSNLAAGVAMAQEVIDAGKALTSLERLIECSNQLAA